MCLLTIVRKQHVCSFNFDNHCLVRVQQIAGLLEKYVRQNVCSYYKQFFGGFKQTVWAFMKVDTRRCTSLIPVSLTWVNWNEDFRLVKSNSIEDLRTFKKITMTLYYVCKSKSVTKFMKLFKVRILIVLKINIKITHERNIKNTEIFV